MKTEFLRDKVKSSVETTATNVQKKVREIGKVLKVTEQDLDDAGVQRPSERNFRSQETESTQDN